MFVCVFFHPMYFKLSTVFWGDARKHSIESAVIWTNGSKECKIILKTNIKGHFMVELVELIYETPMMVALVWCGLDNKLHLKNSSTIILPVEHFRSYTVVLWKNCKLEMA